MADTINDPLAAASSTGSVPAEEVEIDTSKLTALSHEVISKQATVSGWVLSALLTLVPLLRLARVNSR